MRGITRPCRHSLGPELRERWKAHLCGLCLTLRDEAGQTARVLTGYDMLLPSVLVEAQTGRADTYQAGRCPLRGMRTAEVVTPVDPGIRLAAGASLLGGAAGVDDKVTDGDLPGPVGSTAVTLSQRARRHGERLAAETGFDADTFTGAAAGAAQAEVEGRTLDDYLAASGAAGGELFAHTAVVAGRPANAHPLRRAGDAFGRLVHLLDAVDDYHQDQARGAFNPLAASATRPVDAHRVARGLAGEVAAALAEVDFVDADLANALLGPTLERAVERSFRARPAATAAVAALAVPAVVGAIFGGRRGWRRRPPYGDPYYPPDYGYGYRRRGPRFSCCDLLACDCCANMACSDCCGGGDDCCCCCC